MARGAVVVQIRDRIQGEQDKAREAREGSDAEVVERFRRWWAGRASSGAKSEIRRLVLEETTRAHDVEARAVLEFLNEHRPGKRGFRPTDANLRLIRARLSSGITADELRQIVMRKVRECSSEDFDPRYLRPATLFNALRCEQYLGELDA